MGVSDDANQMKSAAMAWHQLLPYVVAAQCGDKEAYDHIYQNLWNVAIGFVRSRFSRFLSEQEVEDVVQDTFVNAWFKLSSLKDPKAFFSWFFKSLVRNCYAGCSSKRDHAALEGQTVLDPRLAELIGVERWAGTPFQELVRKENVAQAKEYVQVTHAKLKEKQKRVFDSFFVNALNESATQQETKFPIGTIRSANWRVKQLLKENMSLVDLPPHELRVAVVNVLMQWSAGPTTETP